MLLLGCSTTVLTRKGALAVSQTQPNDEVLALVGGKPDFVRVVRVEVSLGGRDATWLCCSSGDIVIGESTRIVTSLGLRSGRDLNQHGSVSDIGRMTGDWPPLEVFSDGADCSKEMNPDWERVLCQFVEHARISSTGSKSVLRVGYIPEQSRQALGQLLVGGVSELEVGPAGWSWLRHLRDTEKAPPALTNRIVRQAVLAFWQSQDLGETFILPIEAVDTRHLSIACLGLIGDSYRLDYRPHYLPLESVLTQAANPEHHSPLQVLLRVERCPLVGIELARSGCYLVANQLLCAA